MNPTMITFQSFSTDNFPLAEFLIKKSIIFPGLGRVSPKNSNFASSALPRLREQFGARISTQKRVCIALTWNPFKSTPPAMSFRAVATMKVELNWLEWKDKVAITKQKVDISAVAIVVY